MHTLARAVIARTREAVFAPEVAVLFHKLTYDMLDNVKPPFEDKCPKRVVEKLSRFYVEKDIESCYEEVKELYNDGVLFSEDDYAQFAKYSMNAAAVCVEDYIQSAQLVLMYHKCTSFYPNHQFK